MSLFGALKEKFDAEIKDYCLKEVFELARENLFMTCNSANFEQVRKDLGSIHFPAHTEADICDFLVVLSKVFAFTPRKSFPDEEDFANSNSTMMRRMMSEGDFGGMIATSREMLFTYGILNAYRVTVGGLELKTRPGCNGFDLVDGEGDVVHVAVYRYDTSTAKLYPPGTVSDPDVQELDFDSMFQDDDE